MRNVKFWLLIPLLGLSGWVNQNSLFKQEPKDSVALEKISGTEWVLKEWKRGEPATSSPEVTLKYEDDKFTGRSGCNRYSSPVKTGSTADALSLGPTISTRMFCGKPAMSIEKRFLKQLKATTRLELPGDELALTYKLNGVVETMLFRKK